MTWDSQKKKENMTWQTEINEILNCFGGYNVIWIRQGTYSDFKLKIVTK